MEKKKITDRDYLFISSVLKAKEKNMLRREQLERMVSSGSFAEMTEILTEIGWDDMAGMDAAAVCASLAERQKKIYEEIDRYAPEKEIAEIFRLRYDYHNAKVLIKGEHTAEDTSRLLSSAGRIAPERLSEAFRTDNYRAVPGQLGSAMGEAKSVLARTGNPQTADFVLDKAYFADMTAAAERVDNAFVRGYVRLLIDSANLRAAVRCARMKKDELFLREALAEGGNIPAERVAKSFSSGDGMAELFASTPLVKAAELGDAAATGGRLTEFERECDNAVNRYITAARSCGFGPEIVLAYLAAEENTTTAVRMVLTGRLAGVSREHMKERLRESYV